LCELVALAVHASILVRQEFSHREADGIHDEPSITSGTIYQRLSANRPTDLHDDGGRMKRGVSDFDLVRKRLANLLKREPVLVSKEREDAVDQRLTNGVVP